MCKDCIVFECFAVSIQYRSAKHAEIVCFWRQADGHNMAGFVPTIGVDISRGSSEGSGGRRRPCSNNKFSDFCIDYWAAKPVPRSNHHIGDFRTSPQSHD